jgi:hypothetical protein
MSQGISLSRRTKDIARNFGCVSLSSSDGRSRQLKKRVLGLRLSF